MGKWPASSSSTRGTAPANEAGSTATSLRQAIASEVDAHARLELAYERLPAPFAVPGAVDEDKSRHPANISPVRALPTDTIAPLGDEQVFFRRVFAWMAVGLTVTGGVAGWIGSSSKALNLLFQTNGRAVIVVCALVELLLVAGLVTLVQRMDLFEAAATFLAYAALNGVTISIIFAVFTTKSIFVSFLVTAAMFGALALWGYTTGADLTSWGSFLFMALVGQLIGLVVNLFWLNDVLYWATTATGVLIFSAYTAYDVQRLKRYDTAGDPSSPAVEKQAIVGALALYLDFVNLFLYVIRIMGRRK